MSRLKYAFDSSAINRLLDDQDRDAIVSSLLVTSDIRVSYLNIIEAGRTPNSSRREALLRLLRRLAANVEPLEEPTELLKRAARCYHDREPTLTTTIGTNSRLAWSMLEEPASVDDEMSNQLNVVQIDLEEKFLAGHEDARPEFQRLFEEGLSGRPRSASQLLKAYHQNERFLWNAVNITYEIAVGEPLPENETRDMLNSLPRLSAYLAAWSYSIYRRSVAKSRYGKNNAGDFDLRFATYLPDIDRFITADKKQRLLLRFVARSIRSTCKVSSYDGFRNDLLIG